MPKTRKGRSDIENSGYYRVIASKENDEVALALASVFSEMQAKVICNGNMLDTKIIPDPRFNPNNVKCKVKSSSIDPNDCNGHYAHFEVMQKDCISIDKKCIQLDYVSIDDTQVCIYEIKDGDNFDTKKSEGEVESLSKATTFFKRIFPEKVVTPRVVLWNAKDLSKVSFKAKYSAGYIIRGMDFCKKYNIDWDGITTYRMSLGDENQEELIKRLEEALTFAKEKRPNN
jgi:hypothetical protein